MKKLRVFLLLVLAVAMLSACGGEPKTTEAPTTVSTEAPTTAPTTVPTEAPTEPALEPIVNFYFDEPEGFVTTGGDGTVTVILGPDNDGSLIGVMLMDEAVDFSELTEESIAANLGLVDGGDTTISMNFTEPMEIDGYPAYLVDYNVLSSDLNAHYSNYYVTDGISTFVFTFTDASADGKWAEAYADSAASINLLVEGEYVPADTTGLEMYDLGCGLSMYAEPGMELVEIDGYAAALANERFTVLVIQDSKAEYGLYGLTVEDYASLYVDGELITGFETDACGNVATAYLNQGNDGLTYFYYVVAKNTADNFYLIQCACSQEDSINYAYEFAQWCATITAAS